MSIISLEQEVRDFLSSHSIAYQDFSDKPITPDFGIMYGDTPLWLEVKEKRQQINLNNWPKTPTTPEEYMFIIDELTARRLMLLAPMAGIVVRDNNTWRYVFINVLNLWTMPRLRVNRRTNERHVKGKWIIDLRNGVICTTLVGALKAFYEYAHRSSSMYENTRCVGRFVGELVGEGGEFRTEQQRQYDLMMTR